MPNHQAVEQMLGYLYQIRYALALLLDNDNENLQISIEKFDDIAFSANDVPKQLIQLKHHVRHQGSLTDASTEWKKMDYRLAFRKLMIKLSTSLCQRELSSFDFRVSKF